MLDIMMRQVGPSLVQTTFKDSEMNRQHHAVMNTLSTKEQFDTLMAEAEAEAFIGEFGSDEQLEARIAREYQNNTSCYC